MATPAKVTGLSITSRASAAVGLAWAAAANAVAYEVHRAPIVNGVQQSFRAVNILTVAGITYMDNGTNSDPAPVAGSFYAYKVRGIGSADEEGAFSAIVMACAAAAITRVEGFREEDIAPIFLNPQDFGSVAIWYKTGANQQALRCIFDDDTQIVDPDTGQTITTAPQMQVATADIAGMVRNEKIEFKGLFYRVKSQQPDGTGLSVVELSRDQAL